MDNIFEKFGLSVFVIVGFVLTLAYTVAAGGYVTATMWEWFVVPVFDLPQITQAQACGITLAFVALKGGTSYTADNDDAVSKKISFVILSPWVLLGLGWCVKLFQ